MGFMFVLLLPCPELSATPPATLKFGAAYAIPTARPDVYAHPAAGLRVRSIGCSITSAYAIPRRQVNAAGADRP